MKIVADENIPCVEQAFASLGEVTLLPGRAMRAADVRDANILLVRSVTRVDAALLEGSAVRFVGSATIGFDHVDRDYLARRGIGFSTAPGSNAISAAEYVVSAIMVLSERASFNPAAKTVGIIGYGNVGSRVHRRLAALGMQCVINDPPLQAGGDARDFIDQQTAMQADIVTVHVPYTRDGRWPTHHLVNPRTLASMRRDAIFINTSRGAVADNTALYHWLGERPQATAVLDVWEGEPAINTNLLERVALATPHIAGYSLDGKLRGTGMIYRAACEFLGQPSAWHASAQLPPAPAQHLVEVMGADIIKDLRRLVLACYDIRADDARMRTLARLTPAEQPAFFDQLRKTYRVRREFAALPLLLGGDNPAMCRALEGLGFMPAAEPDVA